MLYDEYPQFQEEYGDVKILLMETSDPLQINTVNKAVRTLEDMKGLIIRVPSELTAQMVTLLGATPVFMPMTDLYVAMERGTVDGALYTIEAVQAFKLQDVEKYCTVCNLCCNHMCLGMNINSFNSLPADVQELITTGDLGVSYLQEGHIVGFGLGTMEGTQLLEEGNVEMIELSPEEQATWLELLMPLRQTWVSEREAAGQPGGEILDRAIQIEEELMQ